MKIELSRVASVYSGKPGCMCGCLGKYYYAEQHRKWSSNNRGYEVEDDEINDSMVRRVVRLLEAHADDLELSPVCVFMDTGTRYYAAYWNKN